MDIQIIRSPRRSKTISARLQGNTLVIQMPADLSPTEEQSWVEKMRARVHKARERRAFSSDDSLEKRAAELNRDYFDGKLEIDSIRYVTNQNQRFGSCTPANRTIRLSDRLRSMPSWVRDYVIVHELAHLVEPNHGRRFWRLVNRYKLTERARGYLMATGLEEPEESAED